METFSLHMSRIHLGWSSLLGSTCCRLTTPDDTRGGDELELERLGILHILGVVGGRRRGTRRDGRRGTVPSDAHIDDDVLRARAGVDARGVEVA